MKKIISAILIAAFAISFASPALAFYYPGVTPTDDGKWNNFGPMTSNLLLTTYASQEGEYLAFKACDIDFMDWSLIVGQLNELNTEDPTMATYARAFFVDRGMREFDLNNMRFPTDDVQFRKALSHMFDKATFAANQLGGYAAVMDSPLQNHGGWYNPYCTGLYPYSLATAQAILTAAGYVDSDSDGWREGPLGQEIMLDVYIRSDDPDRDVMGQIMCANIVACGIQVNEQHQPRSVCRSHCMVAPYDYNIYTGGWSFGRDPDTMYSLYHGQYAQAFDGTPNYPGYDNPLFDVHADAMLTAAVIGVPTNPCDAMYHVYEMQRIFMDDAGIIPVFTYASYGSYKTGWNKVVNGVGVGPWSWYTFMDTYKTGTDTIRWGQMNDITDVNPLHSQWVWDWNFLALVYDSMINVNPYDPSQDLPWLAESWVIGEWTSGADTWSTITFKLREDVYWHDGEKFTADDVIFSIIATRDIPDSWNNALVANVLYAEKIDPYQVKVYLNLLMPLWALHWVGGLPIIPKHIWKPVYDAGQTKTYDAYGNNTLIGTGPWIFDKAASTKGSYYMFRANTDFFRYHPIDLTARVNNNKVITPCVATEVTVYLHNYDMQRDPIPATEFTVNVWITLQYATDVTVTNGGTHVVHVAANTVTLLYTASNPTLGYCEDVLILTASWHVQGKMNILNATISDDPLTGHADTDGYTMYIWGTIPEDINLDFFVNSKDAVLLGKSFGAPRGTYEWNAEADINGDGFVNSKDAVKLGTQFGYQAGACLT